MTPTDPSVLSTAEIRRFVEEAELPPLLASLAYLLGDASVISDDLRPPLDPAQAEFKPQGGLSETQQNRARDVAVAALMRYLAGERAARPLSTSTILSFLTHESTDEYLPLLHHELDLGEQEVPAKLQRPSAPPLSAVVIGAGMSGMAMSHRLQDAGVTNIVLEKNDDVGGTWLENRYPGCRLDTNNFAYSYSFAQRTSWPNQFSKGNDIWEYFREFADEYGVRDRVVFGTRVESVVLDEATGRWTVTSRDAAGNVRQDVADVVVSAVGQLNTPKMPAIEGIDSFEGDWCHSATWRPDLDVTGRRVAVIGSGASGYQIVPSIVDQVESLTVFQRTPPWMLPTPTYTDPIKPGMQALIEIVPEYSRWFRFWQFWLATEGRLPLVTVDDTWSPVDHEGTVSPANALLRSQLVARLEEQYAEHPEMLPLVTPSYAPGGKRLLRDDGTWAKALQSDHVELVTDPIERITPRGVQLRSGREVEVDVIVYATGFEASDFLAPMQVVGVGQRDLHEYWDGAARAYKGTCVPGFPGLFLLYGPNTNLVVTGSAVFMSECSIEYVLRCLEEVVRRGEGPLQVTEEAFDAYNREMDQANRHRAWGVDGVTSWYKNDRGRVTQNWPLSLLRFFQDSRRVEKDAYTPIEGRP